MADYDFELMRAVLKLVIERGELEVTASRLSDLVGRTGDDYRWVARRLKALVPVLRALGMSVEFKRNVRRTIKITAPTHIARRLEAMVEGPVLTESERYLLERVARGDFDRLDKGIIQALQSWSAADFDNISRRAGSAVSDTITARLRELIDAGVVRFEIEGNRVFYSLVPWLRTGRARELMSAVRVA